MMFFGILSMLLVAVSAADFCYSDVETACSATATASDMLAPKCNAQYGAITEHEAELQAYANANIESSFEFLLMSTHFGNYEAQREGFKQLYRKLSDKTWEDAINVIKYIAKRGGIMNFAQPPRFDEEIKKSRVVELNELNSLAKALDTEKQLAKQAFKIHEQAQTHKKQDAAIAHYIEEQFLESHTKCVRDLAGYTSDLKKLLTERNAVSVFLFDEFLKKTL